MFVPNLKGFPQGVEDSLKAHYENIMPPATDIAGAEA